MTRPAATARANRASAIRLARRSFFECRRIDAGEIARELQINRATLYRWFGGRDRLLGEMLWSLTADTFAWAESEARGQGTSRIVDALRLHIEAVAENRAYRHFLRSEPEVAARVLFTERGNVRPRTIERVEELLLTERESLPAGVEPRSLAIALVRIGEAFLYGDQLGRAEPEIDDHIKIVELILR